MDNRANSINLTASDNSGESADEPDGRRPFSDIPTRVWQIFVGTWVVFTGLLWMMFGHEPFTRLMLAIVTFFAFMYFMLPCAMLGQSLQDAKKDTTGAVETLTGRLSMRDAALQILLIPLTLTLGLILMAIFAVQWE